MCMLIIKFLSMKSCVRGWGEVGIAMVAGASPLSRRNPSMGATFCDVFNSKQRHVALKNVHDT